MKAGAPDIADSGEGILDLREVGDEKEVCCPINDVIDMCDADGFK